MVSRNDLLPGTVISSSRIFRAVSLGTCFRITSRTRSTVLLFAATRHLLQHPQGHRPFTLAVTGRVSRGRRGRSVVTGPFSAVNRGPLFRRLIPSAGAAPSPNLPRPDPQPNEHSETNRWHPH